MAISATIDSDFDLKNKTGEIGALSFDLTCTGTACSAIVTPSELERGGPYTLTITATDIFDNVGTDSRNFFIDRPPSLRIDSPFNLAVARPCIEIEVECIDDNPEGCTHVKVTYGNRILAEGTSSIHQVVSLAPEEGKDPLLTFYARDSVNSEVTNYRRVCVDSSARLSEVASVDGYIIDASSSRLLFSDAPEEGFSSSAQLSQGSLFILDIPSGAATPVMENVNLVMLASNKFENGGYLTSPGALFADYEDYCCGVRCGPLFEYRDSTTDLIENIRFGSLKVNGDYAVYTPERYDGRRIRLDLLAGTSSTILIAEFEGYLYLAANGDILLQNNGQIFRIREGVTEQLTSTPEGGNHKPLSDGSNVIYCRNEFGPKALWMLTESGDEVQIRPPVGNTTTEPGRDYQINNGWIAFTTISENDVKQVWVRSPDGFSEQISVFSTGSEIEKLAPNGEVLFINAGSRYLGVPGGTEELEIPERVGTTLGTPFFEDGNWYVFLGTTLFMVGDESPVESCPEEDGGVADGDGGGDSGEDQPGGCGGCSTTSAPADLVLAVLSCVLILLVSRRRSVG